MNQATIGGSNLLDRFRVQIAVFISLLLVGATEHSTGWLTAWSSHAAFPSRGCLVQLLYIGHPAVFVLLAIITWFYFRQAPIARRLVFIAIVHAACQFIPAEAIPLPRNFLTPVVALVWTVCARFPTDARFAIAGWLLITVVAIASLGILQLHWFWLGLQWSFGLILGQLIHLAIQRVGNSAKQPRRSASYKWQWRPTNQPTTHPAWWYTTRVSTD